MPEPKTAPTHLGDIEYHDTGGDGPVLVFLHLALGAADHWDTIIPLLSDRYRCIAPTLPMGGHRLPADPNADRGAAGLARATADLLDHLDVDEVTLIGNDTGGALAQIVTADHGARVARLVLIAADMYDQFPPKMFAPLMLAGRSTFGVAAIAQMLRFKPAWRLPTAFGWLTYKLRERRGTIAGWLDNLRSDKGVRRDVVAMVRGISTDATNRAAAQLVDAGKPVLIIWGDDDRLFDKANGERMAREVPGARLEMVADARTFVHWDQPERVADLISEFAVPA